MKPEDAIRVIDTISSNLIGVRNNKINFAKLPDTLQEDMMAKENLQ